MCEYKGIWHQVLFPKEKATLRQPKKFIHQYNIPNQSTKELAVLLDQQAKISPASQTIPLQTPTTPISPVQQQTTITTTTTKAIISSITTAATTITLEDIKKVFGKALKWKDPGEGGGGSRESDSGREGGEGGEGRGNGDRGGLAHQSQQVILPVQDEQVMGQLPQMFNGDRTKQKHSWRKSKATSDSMQESMDSTP